MSFSFTTFFYRILIDPVLAKLHETILSNIMQEHRVIDVACGTGSQALSLAGKARSVTGIDLSEEMIATGARAAQRKGITNVNFELADASDLSNYKDHEFDTAITSMSIHQFEANLAVKILTEMKRIASKVIIVDYNHPMPKGFSRSLVFFIERFAGGDHYRNFKVYMGKGGLRYFTRAAGLTVKSSTVKSNSVFLIEVCN